jgi:hypothetical protein
MESNPPPSAPSQMGEAPSERVVELGTFSPPDNFDHGSEFQPEIPRPIPQHIRRGPYARRQRATVYTWLMVGCACLLLASVPFVNELGYYILPLQYLDYIGIGLLVIGGYAFVRQFWTPGLFEYIRYGVPQIGRVRQIGCGPTGAGNRFAPDTGVLMHVEVDYVFPSTQKLGQAFVSTERLPRFRNSDTYSLDVNVGDYVTLVSLRQRDSNELQAGSLKLYGLLGLDPARDYLRKNGKPIQPVSPLRVFLIIIGVVGVMLSLLGFIYAMEFCMPLDDGDWRVGVGALVLGALAGLVFGLWVIRKTKQAAAAGDTAPYQANLRLWPFPLFGLLGSVLLLILFNALLDTSPPEYRPVAIENYWQTTYEFVIRNYNIEYREFGANEPHKRPMKVDQMDTFRATNLGMIDVAQGRFGAKWVRGIYPLIWIPKPAQVPNDTPGLTFQDDRQGGIAVRIIPVIQLPKGETMLPPEALAERAIQQLTQEMERQRLHQRPAGI